MSITIPLALLLNVWYDEACSLSTSSGSIPYAIKRSIEFEFQPPFYYVLLSIWRKLDSSYFFARILSIIFSCASIFISYKFLKKYLKISNPEFATFLIAINPFLIYYATEIRLYTMIVFLSGLLIFLMYEIYLSENKSKVYRILFILLTVISIHSQYYMGFLLAAIGISVFIYKGWNKFKVYLIDMILPLLSLIAVIPFSGAISKQIGFSQEVFEVKLVSIVEFFRARITSYLFAFDLSPLMYFSRFEIWLFLLLIGVIFFFSIKNQLNEFLRFITLREKSTVAILIILLLFYALILIEVGPTMLEIRHTASLFLPLMFTTIALVNLTSKRKFLVFWFLLLCFFYISALIYRFAPLAKEGDSIRVSEYIESHEKENELIFVPYDIIALPLRVHYKGVNPIISLSDSLLFEEGRRKLLEKINSESEYAWFDLPYPDPTWGKINTQVKLCKKFINDNFTLLNKKYFEGMQLWYLKRKK